MVPQNRRNCSQDGFSTSLPNPKKPRRARTIIAWEDDTGVIRCEGCQVMSVERLCRAYGIAMGPEIERLKAIIWSDLRVVEVISADGEVTLMEAISMAASVLWAGGIDPDSVRPEMRNRLNGVRRGVRACLWGSEK